MDPLLTLNAVNTNQHVICSVLCLEWTGRRPAMSPLPAAKQINTRTQSLFCLWFSNPDRVSGTRLQFGKHSYSLQFHASSQVHNFQGAGCQWLTDSVFVYTLTKPKPLKQNIPLAICLIALPRFQSSPSDQCYICVPSLLSLALW